MANQYDPIVIKSGLAGVLGTDTLRADLAAHAGLTTTGLAAGDVVQVTADLTLSKASNLLTSPIVGVYEGVSGSVVREGIVVATFAVGPTTNGEAVYLSSTAGQLTNVKPTRNMLHEVGVVVDYVNRKVLLQQKPVIALPLPTPELWVPRTGETDGYIVRFSLISKSQVGLIGGGYTINGPSGLIQADGYIWICASGEHKVIKYNPDGSEVGRYAVNSPLSITSGGDYVWTGNGDTGNVSKIRISDGAVIGTYSLGTPTKSIKDICYDPNGYIWTANGNPGYSLSKVSTADGSLVATYAIPSPNGVARGVFFCAGYVWLGTAVDGGGGGASLKQVDPSNGEVVRSWSGGIYGLPYSFSFDGTTYLWFATYSASEIFKVNAVIPGAWSKWTSGELGWGATVYDPTTDHLWITSANYGPRIAEYTTGGALVQRHTVSYVGATIARMLV